jgi:hypothetical protein
MNILPTANDPLEGLETYSQRKSAIFPHAKMAMRSVATMKHEGTKLNFTTGTVTQMNYIQKKAGLVGEHHHVYGAVLVEVIATATGGFVNSTPTKKVASKTLMSSLIWARSRPAIPLKRSLGATFTRPGSMAKWRRLLWVTMGCSLRCVLRHSSFTTYSKGSRSIHTALRTATTATKPSCVASWTSMPNSS